MPAAAESEAPKPARRRRRPAAKAQAAPEAVQEDPATADALAPEQAEIPRPIRRRRRPASRIKAEEAETPNLTHVEVPVEIRAAETVEQSASHEADTEDTPTPPRRRRRRGRRGGARHRQTAEQAVAGIPPVPEPLEAIAVPEEPEEEEDEDEEEEQEHEEAVSEGLRHDRGRRRRGGRQQRPKTPAELSTGPDHSKDISFMHPSEREFAHLLEYYGIKYLYEPRSFPLRWDGDRVVQMFTPDFYLPEYDQYFELTTMKQNLVTQKNRKLRQVRELYPEVNVQLLYRRDLMRLMGKYGHGPLSEVSVEGTERVLFSEDQVRARVKELGRQITNDYEGREPVLIGVLRGVVVFMADLMRDIDLPMQIEFMEISHYGEEREDSIEVIRDAGTDVIGRDVILVEDIVDTGLTLRYLLEHLKAKKPASVKVCTLLDKSVRRMADVPLDYVGFEVPDDFVIGYGLDYGGRYRNLRYIGVLKPVEPKPVPQR